MNFLIITCRRLAREKFYALVCIISVALGFASSILISLFLMSELTFDLHHQNHERIYRVISHFADLEIPNSGYEIGPALVRDNPQFLESVRFRGFNDRHLHAEADAEIGQHMFARKLGRAHLAFRAAFAESAGH